MRLTPTGRFWDSLTFIAFHAISRILQADGTHGDQSHRGNLVIRQGALLCRRSYHLTPIPSRGRRVRTAISGLYKTGRVRLARVRISSERRGRCCFPRRGLSQSGPAGGTIIVDATTLPTKQGCISCRAVAIPRERCRERVVRGPRRGCIYLIWSRQEVGLGFEPRVRANSRPVSNRMP